MQTIFNWFLSPTLPSRPLHTHEAKEPWPWNCGSPNESVQRPSQHTSNIIVVRSRILKCEVLCDRFLNQMLFQRTSIHADFSCMVNRNKSRVWAFKEPRSHGFFARPTSKRWFLETSPSDLETSSIRCHVGIHVDFYIHLAFAYYSVGPSNVVWSSQLGPAPHFPPMRVLDV